MSSCVLYSSPNPRVAVDRWTTAPLRDWLSQRHNACCGEKVEPVSTFLLQSLWRELLQPKWTGLIQTNEKTCIFARSPDLV